MLEIICTLDACGAGDEDGDFDAAFGAAGASLMQACIWPALCQMISSSSKVVCREASQPANLGHTMRQREDRHAGWAVGDTLFARRKALATAPSIPPLATRRAAQDVPGQRVARARFVDATEGRGAGSQSAPGGRGVTALEHRAARARRAPAPTGPRPQARARSRSSAFPSAATLKCEARTPRAARLAAALRTLLEL